MPITVECTSCEGKVRVADNLAGRSIKCPKCGEVTRVPGAATTATRTAPQSARALAANKKPKPEEDEDEHLDDASAKASPSARAARKSRRDEEDEDEDDPNVRSVAGAKKKSRRDKDEDEDEDEDEEEVRSARRKGKGSRRDEEEEEDEEDDDDNVKSSPKKKGKDSGGRSEDRGRRLMSRTSVPSDMRAQARSALGRGEDLVWVGQPAPKIMVMRSLPAAIGGAVISSIILIVFLTVFMDKDAPVVMKIAFPAVSGVVFLGSVFSPFLARMRARKTLYAITNKRAIVWSCNVVGMVTMTNYSPEQLQNMWRRNSWFMTDQGGGDLVFKTVTVITTTHHYGRRGGYQGSSTSTTTYYYGFLAILYAPEVDVLLRDTLLRKRRRRDEDD